MLKDGVCHMCRNTTQVYQFHRKDRQTCVRCITKFANVDDDGICGNCCVYGFSSREGTGDGKGLCGNCTILDDGQLGQDLPNFYELVTQVQKIVENIR